MASKYDSFWQEKLPDFLRLLREAREHGDSSALPLPELRAVGNRQRWSGVVRIEGGRVRGAEGAVHLQAIGRALVGHWGGRGALLIRIKEDPDPYVLLSQAETRADRVPGEYASPVTSANDSVGGTSLSEQIHHLVWHLPRYGASHVKHKGFPSDGIYFFFEKGEQLAGGPRIVRVGINQTNGRFHERLRDHYIRTRSNSVFRKHVAEALEARGRIRVGEDDLTSHMEETFSFSCIVVPDCNLRKALERWLIACLAHEGALLSSPRWLGKHSPNLTIRSSGLWNVEHARTPQMSHKDNLWIEFHRACHESWPARLGRQLVVIPCSALKCPNPSSPLVPRDEGRSVLHFLPHTAERFLDGRKGLGGSLCLDSKPAAALDRYAGTMYQVPGFRQTIQAALAREDAEVLILSGSYGLVLADEFIRIYDRKMNSAYWNRHGIGEALIEFIKSGSFQRVFAFAGAKTEYGKVLLKAPWAELRTHDCTKEVTWFWFDFPGQEGAQKKVPFLLGKAITSLFRSGFDAGHILGKEWSVSGRSFRLQTRQFL